MGNFIVYGYFSGSVALPEVVAYADTYEGAQMAIAASDGYDLYSIAQDIGGVRFASLR
jgi:hypothetical protein